MLYREGDPATDFYVLLEGPVALYRRVGADDVEVTRTCQLGVYAGRLGQPTSATGCRRSTPRLCGSLEPSRFFVLGAADFAELMNDWFPMAVHLLEGLFFGQQRPQQAIGQRERLLALGLAVGRPDPRAEQPGGRGHAGHRDAARAGRRDAPQARARSPRARTTGAQLARDHPAAGEGGRRSRRRAPALSAAWRPPTWRTSVGDWMDEHGIAGGWELAPSFVTAGLGTDWLDRSPRCVGAEVLEGAVRWLAYTLETELLMSEVEDADDPDLRPGRRRQAVLADRPGARPGASTCTSCWTAP